MCKLLCKNNTGGAANNSDLLLHLCKNASRLHLVLVYTSLRNGQIRDNSLEKPGSVKHNPHSRLFINRMANSSCSFVTFTMFETRSGYEPGKIACHFVQTWSGTQQSSLLRDIIDKGDA